MDETLLIPNDELLMIIGNDSSITNNKCLRAVVEDKSSFTINNYFYELELLKTMNFIEIQECSFDMTSDSDNGDEGNSIETLNNLVSRAQKTALTKCISIYRTKEQGKNQLNRE